MSNMELKAKAALIAKEISLINDLMSPESPLTEEEKAKTEQFALFALQMIGVAMPVIIDTALTAIEMRRLSKP